MKKKTRKFVSMCVAVVMILVCAVPAFAATPAEDVGYSVNSNGETYGNYLEALEIGYEADLILAEGENGILGYVKVADLDDVVAAPEFVTEQTGDVYIPLYKEDGVTVIGRYKVVGTNTETIGTYGSYTYGNTGVMSPYGYTGNSRSGIKGSFLGVTAITIVTTSKQVDINWIGIQARCYKKSDGALVANTSWDYNDSKTDSFSKEVYHMSLLDAEYYSSGLVKLWNPEISDYWTYYTYNSPIAKPST